MAKMWKNIPIMLLIVVFVAVIGGSYGSCTCFGSKDNKESATVKDDAEVGTSFVEAVNRIEETGENIVPDRIAALYNRLTKKQKIAISLVGAAVIVISSFAAHRANYSPAKYDIEKEAQKVSSALETSPARTQDRLQEITTALCTKLSGLSDAPPLVISTLATTIQTSTAAVDTTVAKTTDVMTTEKMTTMEAEELEPEVICPSVAEKIFGYVKNVIGKMTGGFIVFDWMEDEVRQIRKHLHIVSRTNCEADFFLGDDIAGHEGLTFNSTNKFVKSAMNDDACKMAVYKILPVLYEMGHDSTKSCEDGCTLNLYAHDMKPKLDEGLAMANEKQCGDNFFDIDYSRNSIQYQNSNTAIAEAWPQVTNDQKCQQRADRVLALLSINGDPVKNKIVEETIDGMNSNKADLEHAYALGGNCNCGDGALIMQKNNDTLVFTYDNTNPFVLNAWERAPQEVACINTGKNVLAYLLELGFYSADDNASIIIPNWNKNIPNLTFMMRDTIGYNCREGFFKFISEDGYSKLTYKKNNPYIKLEWDKITNEQICTSAANGVYTIMNENEMDMRVGNNIIILTTTQSVKDEYLRKVSYNADSICGEGFFTSIDGGTYVGMSFHSDNQYISRLLQA